jgi:hypothetical protein
MEQKRKLLFIHRKRKKERKITGQPIVWLIIYLVLKTSYTGEKTYWAHMGHVKEC